MDFCVTFISLWADKSSLRKYILDKPPLWKYL